MSGSLNTNSHAEADARPAFGMLSGGVTVARHDNHAAECGAVALCSRAVGGG